MPISNAENAPGETLNLLERVRNNGREHAAEVAIEFGACRVTYGELLNRAETIAQLLKRSGSLPGDIIVVIIHDRMALIPAMLGVLQAGCVFVPINDDAAQERSRQILNRLQPKLILTTESHLSAAENLVGRTDDKTPVVAVPAPSQRGKGTSSPASAEDFTPPPNVPSYVYFTSGTTGESKGIVGTLSSLAKPIEWEIAAFEIGRGCRVSQLITPTFDPWFRDIFVPLCAGGTICIPPDHPGRLNPETLIQWLHDSKINLMHCGPTLLNALVSSPPRIRKLPSLRCILLSGEFLHVSLVARWRRRFGTAATLVNLYGATEATMVQFHHVVQPADLQRDFIPVGRPLPDVDILLVDENEKPCLPGEPGEILIGGSALSLGYFRNEIATRQAFTPIELPDRPPARFYRTGDIGVEFEPGMYRLLGRRDDQVKIRGVRVEPRESEDALTGYPLIAACAVAVDKTTDGEPSLIACVVPETQYAPAIPEMRAYLRERLPLEAIPGKFVFLEHLPLTDTGKVDRRLIPDFLATPRQSNPHRVPPRTVLEKALADYWCEILAIEEVGVHDHFMDLGGHSLSAMRLVTRLRANRGADLSVADVLENPTIAMLAQRIETRGFGETANTIPAFYAPHGFAAQVPAAVALSDHSSAASDDFSCPREPSPLFGRRDCNLIMFLAPDCDAESFENLAKLVTELDPAIYTMVIEDKPQATPAIPRRPTLFFAPALIRNRPVDPGRVICGYPLSKSEEYAVLGQVGIPIPRWTKLGENEPPDLDGFGNYVVRKPDYGGKGAEVRIVKRERVRWKPTVTSAAGPSPTLIVQEFIYTGPWPVSYRVNTLFGRVLYCLQITANKSRSVLRGPEDFDSRGSGNSVSIVSNARDSIAEYCGDRKIIELGERAARAFPDLPMLGVDILEEAGSGRLFVTEVNALGHNWNFGKKFREVFGLDVAQQFNGLRKAAYILAEQTQRLAALDDDRSGN